MSAQKTKQKYFFTCWINKNGEAEDIQEVSLKVFNDTGKAKPNERETKEKNPRHKGAALRSQLETSAITLEMLEEPNVVRFNDLAHREEMIAALKKSAIQTTMPSNENKGGATK